MSKKNIIEINRNNENNVSHFDVLVLSLNRDTGKNGLPVRIPCFPLHYFSFIGEL